VISVSAYRVLAIALMCAAAIFAAGIGCGYLAAHRALAACDKRVAQCVDAYEHFGVRLHWVADGVDRLADDMECAEPTYRALVYRADYYQAAWMRCAFGARQEARR
jgi:hypothetical protein